MRRVLYAWDRATNLAKRIFNRHFIAPNPAGGGGGGGGETKKGLRLVLGRDLCKASVALRGQKRTFFSSREGKGRKRVVGC